MSWLRKTRAGLKIQRKKELPNGLWKKCGRCGEIIYHKELERNLWTCPKCGFHFRIPAAAYISILTDDGTFEEHFSQITSGDPLKFRDSKKYVDRLKQAIEKTGLSEAVVTGTAGLEGHTVALAILVFDFMGGSMASAVGEKVAKISEVALEKRIPLIIISCSGGARMQEGILSLMQMAKTSAILAQLSRARVPFVSIMANPTTGGVTASFASLGDIIIAEPEALIGFAGPRVIEQTINQELPPGFQRSEFLLEHGMIDMIVPRKELKSTLVRILDLLYHSSKPVAT
ncbi:MAG: acetyl-CoA carboxylase, carboxyltransferase subunit beta [Candidatus Eisenbacteria bacterium]|nr:acetyl-CoA carboxylase, carboxyltransferase subunit beta [Candidatus Eisenbacteria bacterium]